MSVITQAAPLLKMTLVHTYPWEAIGGSKTVVDVGGSTGFVSAAIAQQRADLRFIVQDTPKTIYGAERHLPPKLDRRVTFMAHDFFEEQPIKAEVYLFRHILHNWPDKDALRILKAVIPALEPGSKILINDRILTSSNSLLKERLMR